MGKSASDFTLTIQRGRRRHVVASPKDPAFDPGAKATAQMSNGGVAFIATGAGGPSLSVTVVDGDEAKRVHRFCMNPVTGKPYTDLTVTLAGRNAASGIVVYKLEEAAAGEGLGKVKIGQDDGYQGDGAIKFISKRAWMSDGAAVVRAG